MEINSKSALYSTLSKLCTTVASVLFIIGLLLFIRGISTFWISLVAIPSLLFIARLLLNKSREKGG